MDIDSRIKEALEFRELLAKLRKDGKAKCPVCDKIYKLKYGRKEDAPEGSIWREQHLSGICSDKCWDKATLQQVDRYNILIGITKAQDTAIIPTPQGVFVVDLEK